MIKYLIVLLLFSYCCKAQQTDVDFVVEKIKTNYPGFAEKTSGINFTRFVTQTVAANKKDTFRAMAEIIDFFHDRHLDIFRYADSVDDNACRRDLKRVQDYLSSSAQKKKYEGYWLSDFNHCIIALVQTSKKPLCYRGYVIEHRDSSMIPPGLVLYDFEQITGKEYFTRATISSNRSTTYVHSEFRNDTVMTSGTYNKWRKLNHYDRPLLADLIEPTDTTTGRWLDSTTYLLTIPSSTVRNGEIADSLIRVNPAITISTHNLIVDIRNNTGGTVSAFDALLPLLYTDSLLIINGSLYITEDEIKKNKAFVADYIEKGNIDSVYLKSWQMFIKMEEDSIGKFYSVPQDTLVYDTVLHYPLHVSFIVNFACQSASEMILLYALQSKKATIFGEHTAGALDYLNASSTHTPSGKYLMFMATSRRNPPVGGRKLDGIGIRPQVRISDREKDWVDFVKRYYENP